MEILASKRDDFPEWMGAMMVKEFRQGLRKRVFTIAFTAIHLIAALAILVEYIVVHQLTAGSSTALPYALETSRQLMLWLLATIALAVVIPLSALSSLQHETADQNFELLLVTRLSRWRIVLGKWLALCAQSGLILLSLLPYFIARYFLGGMDLVENLYGILSLAMLSAAACAVVLGASAYKRAILRILIGGGGVLALFFTSSITSSITLFSYGSGGISGTGFWIPWFSLLSTLLVYALYTIYGLQLARSCIRLYLLPYEIPSGHVIVTLYFVTPFILGLSSIFCFFVGGGFIVAAVLFVRVLRLDTDTPRPPSAAQTGSPLKS